MCPNSVGTGCRQVETGQGVEMILIVAGNPDLATIWARHLERQGQSVTLTTTETDAIEAIRNNNVDVILLDLLLSEGCAFSVADYASYRRPGTRIIFVSRTGFFSDGSLFRHNPNTVAVVNENAPPCDLAEIVAYHGRNTGRAGAI